MHRIGGTLKVIGRLYFKMGRPVPRSRELADTLIEKQRRGDWFAQGSVSTVPRNVAEVVAYCLETSDYRREALYGTLEALAHDYRTWVNPDGSTLLRRGDRASIGIESATIYGLGVIGGYPHWADCRLPNPVADESRGCGYRYQLHLRQSGQVEIVN